MGCSHPLLVNICTDKDYTFDTNNSCVNSFVKVGVDTEVISALVSWSIDRPITFFVCV